MYRADHQNALHLQSQWFEGRGTPIFICLFILWLFFGLISRFNVFLFMMSVTNGSTPIAMSSLWKVKTWLIGQERNVLCNKKQHCLLLNLSYFRVAQMHNYCLNYNHRMEILAPLAASMVSFHQVNILPNNPTSKTNNNLPGIRFSAEHQP